MWNDVAAMLRTAVLAATTIEVNDLPSQRALSATITQLQREIKRLSALAGWNSKYLQLLRTNLAKIACSAGSLGQGATEISRKAAAAPATASSFADSVLSGLGQGMDDDDPCCSDGDDFEGSEGRLGRSSILRGLVTTVPVLIKTLQSTWSSSRYYSSPKHMAPLLARIGAALCLQVTDRLCLVNLLELTWPNNVGGNTKRELRVRRKNRLVALELVEDASLVLERWRSCYVPPKGCSGRGGISETWGPFDEGALFARVDVVASRCSELREVIHSLKHVLEDLVPRVIASGGDDETSLETCAIELGVSQMVNRLVSWSSGSGEDLFSSHGNARHSGWQEALSGFRDDMSEVMKEAYARMAPQST